MVFNRKVLQCRLKQVLQKSKGFHLKIKYICLLLLSCLLLSQFILTPVSAASIYTSHFKLSWKPYNATLQWSPDVYYGYSNAIENTEWTDGFQIYWSSITAGGNTASIHFETNLVFAQPNTGTWRGEFPNPGNLGVRTCNYGTIQNTSVSTAVTPWYTSDSQRQTLTIYGDVTLTGLSSGTSYSLVCYVGTSGRIYQSTYPASPPKLYFEQNPTQINWSTNIDNSLLQTQIQQNSTIIQQNINTYNMQKDEFDQTQDKIDNLTDSITDDTVSGDFSMPDVPSFGPVATIINSIIDLPRVFLTPGTCQDLVGPMPILTDQNFVIPCPKKLLEPFWDAIVVIENFFAVYIWFRVAMYIVRQVKKLRDPTNDDEEYLDL